MQSTYFHLLCSFFLLRLFYLVLFRLYLHPLRSFPGPRLAAITDYYQAYYAIWQNGMFAKHTEELHRIYGPVVRVRPNELHFQSPEAYFAIYSPHSGFTKDPFFYTGAVDDSIIGAIDVQKHKVRRDTISPLFSRRAILKLEDVVQEKVDLLMQQIRAYRGAPVNLFRGFHSLAMDVVTTYSYAYSFGGLTTPGFNHPVLHSIQAITPVIAASRYFPFLLLMNHLPQWLTTMMNPTMRSLVDLRSFLGGQIDTILANPDSLTGAEHETIYHRLITPELVKSGKVPSKEGLIDEAVVLLVAGTDTSSNAMTIGFFHLLSNPAIMKTLQSELQAAWPEKDMPFSYEMAEKLPYLTGAIKEALRLSTGVPVALPRVVPTATIIDGSPIPAGTVVGVGQPFVLKNPDIFPDPDNFKPERWIGPDAQKLDKYLVAFSRGPRICLGINLAWCELYLTFANLMRKFDMQLFETSKEDMAFRDYMIPVWTDLRPLQAVVTDRET
ncbi:cytochrome P450 [Mucidula mucida]|nr:cytochrome P450 [Mucidula mucida]KAF8883933.1 cytochrome P450 [Mucidula mucida]